MKGAGMWILWEEEGVFQAKYGMFSRRDVSRLTLTLFPVLNEEELIQ